MHHALVGVKTNLASRVEKVLGRDVRYAVPGPVLDELRNQGEAGAAALEFCRRRCRVIATPRACDTAAKAVLHLVGEANGQKFVVATHDRGLQAALRRVPGAPLLYFSGTVLNVDEAVLPVAARRGAPRFGRRRHQAEFRVARAIRAQDRVSSSCRLPPWTCKSARARRTSPRCRKPQKARNPHSEAGGDKKRRKRRRKAQQAYFGVGSAPVPVPF